MTVPSAPITIGITVTFIFLTLRSARTATSTFRQVLFFFIFFIFFFIFFFLALTGFGRPDEISWSLCISQSQITLCVSFSRTDSGLCIYHLFILSNFNFLHNSKWITFPTQSCLILYSFRANLLHSLIVLLVVSFLLWHNVYLLFLLLHIYFFFLL